MKSKLANGQDSLIWLRELKVSELYLAAQLLGRAMCNNPANVSAFGLGDAERRYRALARFFVPVLDGLYRRGLILGAFREGVLVGVCGMARPSFCQPTLGEKLRVIPAVVFGNPIRAPLRIMRWIGEWSRRDPSEPHWHLGPVAVDSHLRGKGIGGAMLAQFCRRMDDYGSLSYLETDKLENVGFYHKFGFVITAEAKVIGVPNWFMSRVPRMASTSANCESDLSISKTSSAPDCHGNNSMNRKLRDKAPDVVGFAKPPSVRLHNRIHLHHNGSDVTAYGGHRAATTLVFLQHHLSQRGHRNTSCDPHLHQAIEQPTLLRTDLPSRQNCFRFAIICPGVLLGLRHP